MPCPAGVILLAEPFTIDNRMLNSTGKMVRSNVVAFHKEKIDFAYTPEAKNIVNSVNEAVIKNLFKVT